MKITRLQKAKGYRVFRDFTWPLTGLPDFGRFNVIYGWNGSGKTSLSNVFRQIQRRAPLTEGQVEVLIDQTPVSGADFATAALPAVRTFNRDTVDRNVFEAPNQQLPPVFFFGEDSIEKQERIESLKLELAGHVAAESRLNNEKAGATTALESFCADEARGIKNLLTVAGGGEFNNYNAGVFKTAVQKLSNSRPLPDKLTDEQRDTHLTVKDGKSMDKLSEPSIKFPDVVSLTSRTQAMLERSVVSSVISTLAEKPDVAVWLNAGVGLHCDEQSSKRCLFCDQPLPSERIQQLQAHFNDELKRFQSDVDALFYEVKLAQDFAKALRAPPQEALYANLRPAYVEAMNELDQQASIVPVCLDILLRALKSKRDEPFKSFSSHSIQIVDLQGDFRSDFRAICGAGGPITTLTSRTQAMLERSVVSSVISTLAEKPDVAVWLNAGVGLHCDEQSSKRCLFCDQPLPSERIQQLQAHFNDELKRFQSDVDALFYEVKLAQDFAKALRAPPQEALYANLRPAYVEAMNELDQQASIVPVCLDILLRALKSKRDEPFKSFELAHFITNATAEKKSAGSIETFFQFVFAAAAALSAFIGKTAFEKMKGIIERHNQHTENFDAEVNGARKALAQDEVLKALPAWQEKSKTMSNTHDLSIAERDKATKLKQEIAELETQIQQHRRPAEELNQEVAAYLGRNELRFEIEQNGYRIMRGGHAATHLSDGERTSIAFLYFLKSLRGTDFDLATGIVVIDDPVSSLDANSLFSAFGFMKQRTAMVGQLFVLTHNFTFFRQVRNWYCHLPGQKTKDLNKQPARFYMLATEFVDGIRTAKLNVLDPFLHQYESEYHYLFKRIYEEANKVSTAGLEAYYAIPNIARRLLEAFLAFRIPDKPGELFQKLECVDYDSAKKTRILRFLHTYSHFDQVAEPDHDPSVLSETPAILQDVLALIQSCDQRHFESMSQLVCPPAVP
jgi:wobble nucleotide-excising tRNase